MIAHEAIIASKHPKLLPAAKEKRGSQLLQRVLPMLFLHFSSSYLLRLSALVLQRHLISSSRGSDGHLCSLQDLQDASPPSLFAPALIATGHRLPGSEAFGKLAPRRTRPHDPQDAFHDQTMLDGGTTGGGLLGQERPQLFPALRRQCLH